MPVQLSIMASNGCLPAFILYQEQVMSRAFQDLPPLLPNLGTKHVITRPSFLTVAPNEQDDMFKSACGLCGFNLFVKGPFLRKMPLLVDLQDIPADSFISSFGMDNKLWPKEMLQFLVNKSNKSEEDYADPSMLPEPMGFQAKATDMRLQNVDVEFSCYGEMTSLCHPNTNYYHQENDEMFYGLPSTISAQSEGHLPFHGTMTDIKDLVSFIEEFTLRKESVQWRKQKMLIPYFRWSDAIVQEFACQSSLKLKAISVAPLKSPEKIKRKPASKRKSKKATRDRDIYRSNSFHACESLLSLMMDKKRNGKSVMSSLKKSGPELPQLLTQFSATIAGTGLALIFSVIYKLASRSVPICSSNVLTSGFGVGLFWVSWAINKLRDTIVYIGKSSAKLGFQEEEMMMRVDKSVKDIVFRAAASVLMLMLRFV